MSFRIPHPARFAVLAILVALILTKIVWVQCCCRDIGTFESEKEDILERRPPLKTFRGYILRRERNRRDISTA